MNNLLKQMQQDAGATAPNNMGKIGAVANDIADTDKEISDIEEQLKKKKDYKKHLSENVLPNLFAEVGLSELKLADGRLIKVGNYYGASIKEDKKEAAFKWFRDNGFGDLVKNQISCSFGRNEDEKARGLIDTLNEKVINPRNVNGSNLPPFAHLYVSNMKQAVNCLWTC